jgi:prolyl oligopeptidase
MRAFLLAFSAAVAFGGTALAQSQDDDPYLWLEEVSSPKAMSWVDAHNKTTTDVLEADPRYKAYYNDALEIAQAKDRIPFGTFLAGQVYNFWQDEDHVRGLWRRTTTTAYLSGKPEWETVLDLDALSTAEKANWVWKGASCARPAERRCLVFLSDGGEDKITVREFDLPTKKFVAGGFSLPKGKQDVSWQDENTLLISREWEPGMLTDSGYPYVVKRLKRGQKLSQAVELFRGKKSDVNAAAGVLRDAQERTLPIISEATDFFHSNTFLLGPKGHRKIAIPAKAGITDLVAGRAIISIDEDWQPIKGGKTYPAGSILSVDLAALRANPGQLRPTLIFAPGPKQSIGSVASTRDVLLVSGLDNVRGRVWRFTPTAKGWSRSAIDVPDNMTVSLVSTGTHDNRALMAVTGFLTPPSLWLADAKGGSAHTIMSQPAKFDASDLVTEQREAASTDGTRIPYFLVHRRDMKLDGTNPTLLYAYGGFQSSQTPFYSGTRGKLWLEKGGVFALANIRGGGEFGPAWHEAGLKIHRQIVFDDFASVGRDLIAAKVTSPRRLGIEGGSNGGLLTGVSFIQHPELWNAALIEVPLLDMIRISKIAAGASWEGEYGSISDPAVKAFWEKTSPYQNLRKDGKYPVPFIFTTTKDDRVGPQHARKFAARMEEYGLPFYYYENTEGGHAAGANLRQAAHTSALEMIYLTRKLMDPEEPAK